MTTAESPPPSPEPSQPQATPDGVRVMGEGHGRKPRAVRERAIVAVLSERSLAEAAKRAGIGEKTLKEWLARDPEFQADLAEARRTAFEAGMGRVQALVSKSVETLDGLLDPSEPPGVRLGAARTLVEIGLHQQDAEIIQRRMAEIEASLQRPRHHNGRR
ncbi:MAG: hypothetical protein AB1806_13970 [Acidobacteriota bacterium]